MSIVLPTDGYYIYDFISPDAGSSVWGPRLDQIAAGGFKLVNNYAILAGSTANMQAYINYAASKGLKVIISLELVWHVTISTTFPTLYTESGHQSTIAGFDTYVVNTVKGLAGTWGYYVADEPADASHSTVLSHFNAIKASDNTKPCLLVSTGDLSTGSTFWGQNCVFFDCCTVGGDSHYTIGLSNRNDDPATVAQGTQAYCTSKSIKSATVLQANNSSGTWPTLADQVAIVKQVTAHMQAQLIGWYAYHSIWGSPSSFAGFGPFSASDNPTQYWNNLVSAINYISYYDKLILSNGPLKYYPLDDCACFTHIDDLVGTDQTAGWVALTRTTGLIAGDVDSAMSFVTASSSAISLPTSGLPSGSHAHSLEAWMKVTSYPGGGNYPIIVSLGTSTTNQEAALYFNGDVQRIAFTFYGADVDALIAPIAGTIYHVVGTFDGSTMRLYINGVLQGSLAHTPNITYGIAAIGKDGGGNFFNGVIAKGAIYGYALSAAQVLADYTAGPKQLKISFVSQSKYKLKFSEAAPMILPNSTTQSSATVTDANNNPQATLTGTVTVMFQDGTTLGPFTPTNAGAGVYTLTYTTKGPGVHTELWSFVDGSGNTLTDTNRLICAY